ncbi:MAG: DUF2723 domain-containing protein [Chthoniobacterales bacterium]|nr:DUF2723 domain-containing protein [Chthoniobacterales bacterium]
MESPSPLAHPFQAFSKGDRQTALLCFLIALITFWYTAMPNIGLGDDGEMATAALHLGVPHPSGYPLWTISAGLFAKLIPFGNGAWKLNLFSGLCAAAAVGIFSLLSRSTARWVGLEGRPATLLAVAASLTFAWSVPVWSQATIGKGTYSLHVLLMLVLAGFCYLWIRTPSWKNAFVWVVFSFALGMSNHHMTLAMAMLPLLVILLLHKDLFWEYTLYSLLIGSGLYVGFGYLSSNPDVMKIALRFCYTMLAAFFVFLLLKKKLTEWKRGLLLVVVVTVGLLPYLYMPLASSTNPPMNWSYTSTREGFFYAINRSQYWGTLSDQLQGTIGKLMGVPPAAKATAARDPNAESPLQMFWGFFRFFCKVLLKNISPLPLLGVICLFLFLKNHSREERIWAYLLSVGFLLAAFFEPIMAPNGYDNNAWDMQKPWQGLCYGFLLLLAAYGAALTIKAFEKKLPRSKEVVLYLFGAVAIYTFVIGLPRSSQRGHWFGWMYGHDMLADLPPNSFFFGGTDPGRFVPTFMIFGESFEAPKSKRDPNFDRRDLYVVTQNALADNFYNQYIRSQYSNERPVLFNWLERWLGRDHVYPQSTLTLPHREEIVNLYQNEMLQFQRNPGLPNPQTNPAVLNSDVAEWIFLRNRDQHRFFVEESFPMPWSYPYAIPHGLCYEINHDPVPTLSPEIVAHDQEFWINYIKKLRSVPGFENDSLAQHCFAKLRNTTGNLYNYRSMKPEAEFAYRQALDLWPGNSETVENMLNLLLSQSRYQEAEKLVAESLLIDPNSKALQRMKMLVTLRWKASKEIPQLQQELMAAPTNRPLFSKLLRDYQVMGDQVTVNRLISNAIATTPADISFLREIINFYAAQNNITQALAYTEQLAKLQPNQWDVPFTIAKYQLILGDNANALASLQQTIALGGNNALQQILRDPVLQQISRTQEFQQMLKNIEKAKSSFSLETGTGIKSR